MKYSVFKSSQNTENSPHRVVYRDPKLLKDKINTYVDSDLSLHEEINDTGMFEQPMKKPKSCKKKKGKPFDQLINW